MYQMHIIEEFRVARLVSYFLTSHTCALNVVHYTMRIFC